MLENLLRAIAKGGVQSARDLARSLSVSEPLLEAMLGDLEKLGYLKPAGGGCDTHCGGCARDGCAMMGHGRLWTLTARGARAASTPSR